MLHGYRIDVQGEPNATLKLFFRPDDFANFDIGTTTAMPAINAVELPIVTARAGLL
jgi:2,4-diaminopentanoate dehydrogenase